MATKRLENLLAMEVEKEFPMDDFTVALKQGQRLLSERNVTQHLTLDPFPFSSLTNNQTERKITGNFLPL